MEGIILGVSNKDYSSELNVGDLVCIDEELEDFYTITEINEKFLIDEPNKINNAKYIVKSKIDCKKMNFERHEISKSNIAVYDANRYFIDGIKIKIGDLINDDIRNMKFKAIIDLNLETSFINDMTNDYLIGLIFNGDIIKKPIKSPTDFIEYHTYFKVKTPELV